jgi:hypothetical protein
LLATAQTVPSYVPTSGLVGWWPFNGNANDESGNGNNGTVNGATLTTDRNGNASAAYDFNGANTYIEVLSNSSLQLTNNYTLNGWFNADVFFYTSNADRSLLSKVQSGGWYGGYEVMVGGNTNDIAHTGNVGGNNFVLGGTGYSTVTWYMFSLTYDGATMKLYMNGILVNSQARSGSLQTSGQSLLFGRRDGNLQGYFDGKLDDIGIWNRALTPCEIQALYNSGNSGITTAASSSSSICFGSSTTLSASGAATYSWMPGNLSGDSLSVSPAATTTYIVTGTDSSGCNSIDSVTIVVNALPQVVGVSTTSTYCLEDANGSLAGTPTPGTWSGPGVTGNSFNPATAGAGTHSVVYTYTDNNGCSNSDTLTMTVDLCTGLTEETNSSFTVFPNPANNNITVTWAIPNVNTLTLSDATGRAVRTYNVSGTQAQLSLEGLASGVYFLIVNGEGKAIQKFVKQ